METVTIPSKAQNYINGHFIDDNTASKLDVYSPIDGKVISAVTLSSEGDLDEAVSSAHKAFSDWSKKTLKQRAQVFFKYRQLLEQHIDCLLYTSPSPRD